MKRRTGGPDWLIFSKRERNGIAVLSLLLFLLLCYNYYYSNRTIAKDDEAFQLERMKVLAWMGEKTFPPDDPDEEFQTSHDFNNNRIQPPLFHFNPNALDDSSWKLLGLTEHQIHGIRRFEEKGGIFRTKEDLKKMYTVPADLYIQWEPWIDLPDSPTGNPTGEMHHRFPEHVTKEKYPVYQKKEITVVELNSADTTDLQSLPGIGPYYARKIIEYRDRLGGYLNTDQLMEVWKMDAQVVENILPYLTVTSSLIHRLNLNISPLEDFLNHPYLSKNQARSIVSYREQHGSFTSIEDLKKLVLIDEVTFARLKAYITL